MKTLSWILQENLKCIRIIRPDSGLLFENEGARATATLLHEMKRRGKDCRFGVVSMCIGK